MNILKRDMLKQIIDKYGKGSDEVKIMLQIVLKYNNLTFIRRMFYKIMNKNEG